MEGLGPAAAREVGKKCLAVAGDSVSLSSCSHASSWEITASNQLKTGENCMSQAGSFTGSEDVAASAPIHATSTGDSALHGAKMAVDGDEASYWRSDPGSDAAQELTIDLGGARKLATVEIVWEAPAESFAIQVSKVRRLRFGDGSGERRGQSRACARS